MFSNLLTQFENLITANINRIFAIPTQYRSQIQIPRQNLYNLDIATDVDCRQRFICHHAFP